MKYERQGRCGARSKQSGLAESQCRRVAEAEEAAGMQVMMLWPCSGDQGWHGVRSQEGLPCPHPCLPNEAYLCFRTFLAVLRHDKQVFYFEDCKRHR